MTFENWCGNDYNTDGYKAITSGMMILTENSTRRVSSVNKFTVITADATYGLEVNPS